MHIAGRIWRLQQQWRQAQPMSFVPTSAGVAVAITHAIADNVALRLPSDDVERHVQMHEDFAHQVLFDLFHTQLRLTDPIDANHCLPKAYSRASC